MQLEKIDVTKHVQDDRLQKCPYCTARRASLYSLHETNMDDICGQCLIDTVISSDSLVLAKSP